MLFRSELSKVYQERREIIVTTLTELDFIVQESNATMFVWAKLPEKFSDSYEFSKKLLDEANVAVSPGIGFGSAGEGYIRLALVENKHRIRQAMKNLIKFFDSNV